MKTPLSRHRVTPTVASHPLALEVPYVGRETAEALAKHDPPVLARIDKWVRKDDDVR